MRKRCSGCGKSFKSSQALGSHRNYCQRLKERPETPARAGLAPAPEKRVSGTLPEGLTWGIDRRRGKWEPIPMISTGMAYEAARKAADDRNKIPPVRRSRPLESAADDDDTDKALFLLLMMAKHL